MNHCIILSTQKHKELCSWLSWEDNFVFNTEEISNGGEMVESG